MKVRTFLLFVTMAATAHADAYDSLLKRYEKQINAQEKQLETLSANLQAKEREAKRWQDKADEAKTAWSQAQADVDRAKSAVQTVHVQRLKSQAQADAAEWSVAERSLLAAAADQQAAYLMRELYEQRASGLSADIPAPIAQRNADVLERLCDISTATHHEADLAKTQVVALRSSEMRLQTEEQRRSSDVDKYHENQQALWLRWQDAERRQTALEDERNQVEQSEQALRVMVQELRDHRDQALASRRDRATTDIKLANLRGTLPWPAYGRVSQNFGRQYSQDLQQLLISNGIKIDTGAGHAVRAIQPGHVLFASAFRQYGQMVIVQHKSGLTSVYGGLGGIDVKEGDDVDVLQGIGTVADSGSFYFELRRDEEPVDPLVYLVPNHSDTSLRRKFQ